MAGPDSACISRLGPGNGEQRTVKTVNGALLRRVRARISWHFGASAGRADARRRDAGDVVTSSRSGNAADARPPPRPSGLRPAGPLAVLLAPYVPQRVCSSLAPCQRAWGPAAKCTPYFLTGPKTRRHEESQKKLPSFAFLAILRAFGSLWGV